MCFGYLKTSVETLLIGFVKAFLSSVMTRPSSARCLFGLISGLFCSTYLYDGVARVLFKEAGTKFAYFLPTLNF